MIDIKENAFMGKLQITPGIPNFDKNVVRNVNEVIGILIDYPFGIGLFENGRRKDKQTIFFLKRRSFLL